MKPDRYELFTDATIGRFAEFHINPDELNEVVEAHGVGCDFWPATRCPCARIESLQPAANCPHCYGLGFLYPEADRRPIIALVLNREPRRTFKAAGELVIGTVTITFPSNVRPGEGDLVWPSGETHVVFETLTRARLETDHRVLRQRIQDEGTSDQHLSSRFTKPRPERLLYRQVAAVEAVHWLDPDDSHRLIRGTVNADFTIENGVITWRDGHGPKPGDQYTVRYTAPAAYACSPAEPIFRQEHDGPGFPYRVQAHRLDKLGHPDLR